MRTCPFCRKPIPRKRLRKGVLVRESDAEYALRSTCGRRLCRYKRTHTSNAKGRRSLISLQEGWPEVTGERVADFRPHELRFAQEPALMVARPERQTFNYHGNSSASVAVR